MEYLELEDGVLIVDGVEDWVVEDREREGDGGEVGEEGKSVEDERREGGGVAWSDALVSSEMRSNEQCAERDAEKEGRSTEANDARSPSSNSN